MNSEEHQLLDGLFDRIRAAATAPRDPQAEAFIAEGVKAQPHAPYLLAQAVLVQEQALGAANGRIQELEAKLQSPESQASGSFLGGLGKSLFGGSSAAQVPPAPPAGGYAPQTPPAAPWGQGQPAAPSGPSGQQPSSGGGFLSGALTTAAGVAGGMLLADSMLNLFTGGHNATLAGIAGGTNPDAVRAQDALQDQDQDQDDLQDAADNSGADLGDDGSNV
jgi:uncharacterized protein